MNSKTFFLLITLSFAFTAGAYSQNIGGYLERKAKMAGKRASNRADENVDKKVNGEVDKAVDNAFNKLWGNGEKKKDDGNSEAQSEGTDNDSSSSPSQSVSKARDRAASNAMMKAMGVSMDANVQETYDYDGNIVMTVQSWDESGDTEGEVLYTSYIRKDNAGFAMEFSQPEKGKSVLIFDYKNGKMLIMNNENGDKTGMSMQWEGMTDSLENYDYSEPPSDDEIEDFSAFNEHLTRTGKSKKIAGYKCDEYIYDDEESHAVLWMTDELPPELWANMFSANTYAAASMGFYGGFVMEMDSKEKNTDERTTMVVNEVNRNQSKSVSTAGYTFMSFNSSKMMKEEEKEEK